MNMSDDGLARLEKREGKCNKAYMDTKGIWTIGVGHTGNEVFDGLEWTDAEVDAALRHDIKIAEAAINDLVTVPLTQYQFDALVSFVFNVGVHAFATSTMLKRINEGSFAAAATEFDKWHIPKEIIFRRDSERDQFRGL